ncbi:MAG: HK97 family phage prohead protease [Anaerolineae bacterium]|nr:HK97 family phage prohead protease [Anaerolineae bacterium]
MKRKTYSRSNLKLTSEPGEFECVFATLNEVDADGDVTLPGAFEDGAAVRIAAWGHRWDDPPVGKGTIYERGNEAVCQGHFFLDTQAGADTYRTVKNLGDLQEWSYGYDVLDSAPGTWEGRPVRLLKRLKVYEVSPVLLGAGVRTRTTRIKGLHPALWRLTPASVRASLEELAGPDLFMAAIDDALTDAQIEEIEARARAARLRRKARSNLEILRAAIEAYGGGGHSQAWVKAMVRGEIEAMVDRVLQYRPDVATRDEAERIVSAWLSQPVTQ